MDSDNKKAFFVRLIGSTLVITFLAILALWLTQEPVRISREPIETTIPNKRMMKIAHRGASKFAPENTLPALEKAVELGYDYVELDVRETSDGIPILMHDATVDRTTNGTGPVYNFSLAEIKKLDAGKWFAEEFAGTTVPTLEEALQLLQGKACIFWDTKGDPKKTDIAAKLFRQHGFSRDCLLISFGGLGSGEDPQAPKKITGVWPEAPLMPQARNTDELSELLDDYPNIRGINVPINKLAPELVEMAHANGLLVGGSALVQYDHHHAYKKFMDAGADILMLDHIDTYYNYLETGDLSTPAAPPLPKAGYYSEEKMPKPQSPPSELDH